MSNTVLKPAWALAPLAEQRSTMRLFGARRDFGNAFSRGGQRFPHFLLVPISFGPISFGVLGIAPLLCCVITLNRFWFIPARNPLVFP